MENNSSKDFVSLLVLTIASASIFLSFAYTNLDVVNVEVKYAYGITIEWFGIITSLLAILTTVMVFRPYQIDRSNGNHVVIKALLLYILAQIFWSLSLFHSRVNRGTAELAALLLLSATVWLGWVCYHFQKWTFTIFLLLLIWALYLQNYTYNVDSHPWIPVPF